MTAVRRALSPSARALLERVSHTAGGPRFPVHDAARPLAAPIAHVKDASGADAVVAIHRSADAFATWRHESPARRAEALSGWHARMMASAEDLAQITALEAGKALADTRREVAYAASFIDWCAALARQTAGEVLLPSSRDHRQLVLKEPIGPVAVITPWNFPLAMITRKVSAALGAGCTTVVKPAETTPLSALALEALAHDAGIPSDAFIVLTASRANAAVVGTELCQDPRIRALSFTGSTAVGKHLYRSCADTVKKLELELGGNAPFIVARDADVDVAVASLTAAKLRANGQACVAPNRVLVAREVHDEFIAKLVRTLDETVVLGHGLDDGVTMGPLIDAAAREKFVGFISDATSKGAKLVCGGPDDPRARALSGAGSECEGAPFVAPTVVTDVPPHARCWQEEVFSPLFSVAAFDVEDEAFAMANDTTAGLAAYFCSRDLSRCWRAVEKLEAGVVGINEGAISTCVQPFGGVKESGLGREAGPHALEEFLETKSVTFRLSS